MKNNKTLIRLIILFGFLSFGGAEAVAQENYHLDWLVLNDSIKTGSAAFYSEPKILYDSSSSAVYVFDNIYYVSLHLRCTKYSATGEKLWSVRYNRAFEGDWFIDAKLDSQGNVVLMGVSVYFVGDYPFTTVRTTVLMKIAPSGQLIWKIENLLDDETLYDTRTLFVDSEDNIYTSGWKRQGTAGAQQTFLNKYTPDGELDWQKTGFPSGIRFVYEIDGLIGLVGFTSGSEAYFSRKYTKAGGLVTNHYTLVDVTDSYLGSPGIVSHDGGYIRGSNGYGYEIQKFSHEGQVLWSYLKPIQDGIPNPWTNNSSIILEDDYGNAYGIGLYVYGEDDTQILITKIDSIGDFSWEIKVDGEGGGSFSDAAKIVGNYLYVTTLYSNGADSDFGFLIYNLDGELIYKTGRTQPASVGLEYRLWLNDIAIDENENIFILGTNDSYPQYDEYTTVLRYQKEPTAIIKPETQSLAFAPNPVHSGFRVVGLSVQRAASLSVYNTMGQLVFYKTLKDVKQTIDVSALREGIYFVELIQGDKRYVGKMEKI